MTLPLIEERTVSENVEKPGNRIALRTPAKCWQGDVDRTRDGFYRYVGAAVENGCDRPG